MKTVRIFISSPGDVQEERDKAKQVIAALQHELGDDVALLPVLWEDLAIPATASFQEGIDFVLSEKHRIDIAVFILWSRLGTPLGAAITKPDGSAYRSGTEREFDLMLTAFEQSGRKMPLILAYTRDDLGAFSDKLDARTQHDDALEELLRQRKLVKQFIHERFHDEHGRNLRAYHTYREPVGFAQRLHVHLREAVHDLLGLEAATALWTGSPYRSLEVFDIQHAPIFFGRDEETCDVLQRLREQQVGGCAFVCIVGASGSGKSSLARAGVAATLLHRGFDDGIKAWHTAVFIPGHAQGDLFPALTRTLATALPALREGIGGLDKLTQCFETQNHEAASILIGTALSRPNQELRVLFILDQMEELWTDRSITPEQRERFLQTIESLARTGSISVLATLRSDFYPQAQLSPAFLRMKAERGHFDLTPPGTTALQQLIVQPARRAGLRFERDERTGRTLDQRILEDAARDPSALPLLQYALAELYEKWSAQSPERRTTRTLLLSDYDDMGGMEGALAKRAAQTFDTLPADVQSALDELLPLLISVDIAGEQNAVRRRAPLAELTSTPTRRDLTQALVQARFLTTDDEAGQPIATLAHEALLRRWERIRTWIATNRDLLRMRARVEQYYAMWEESGRNNSRLLPDGLPLEEGRSLVTHAADLLVDQVKAFIATSALHHQRRRRRAFLILGCLTAVAIVAGIGAWRMMLTAEERNTVIVKQSAQLQEQANKQKATLHQASMADFNTAVQMFGEREWTGSVAHLAAALSWDPGNKAAAQLLYSTLALDRSGIGIHDDYGLFLVEAMTIEQGLDTQEMRQIADYLGIVSAKIQGDHTLIVERANVFMEQHPTAALAAEVSMSLLDAHFRREDFASARTEGEILAREWPDDPQVMTAVFLAAESAMNVMSDEGRKRAFELFEEVAEKHGPLEYHARLKQAELKSRSAAVDEALEIYDSILTEQPPVPPKVRLAALIGKADMHFLLGKKDVKNFASAITAYSQIIADEGASLNWKNRAAYMKAMTLERLGQSDAALAILTDMLNVSVTSPLEKVWFAKAGFAAAELVESRQQWKAAVDIYEKMTTIPGSHNEEARQRASKLRLEKGLRD